MMQPRPPSRRARLLVRLALVFAAAVTLGCCIAARAVCTAVGCASAIRFRAHLDEPPSALARRSPGATLRVCHEGTCRERTFDALTGPDGRTRWTCDEPPLLPGFHCEVGAEGTGSEVLVTAGEGPFKDDDRLSFQIKIGDRLVVDHERMVSYRDVRPNGPFCGPVCPVADVELWPGSPSHVRCPGASACDPVVRLATWLAPTREGAAGILMTACRNGGCQSAPLDTLFRWDDAKDLPVPMSNVLAGVPPIGDTDVSIQVSSTSRPVTAPYHVVAEFRGDPRTYRAGDVYVLEFRAKGGTVLFHEKRVVAAYDESHPGGPECSSVACRGKDFGD